MDCDVIASSYRTLEYLAFGGRLHRHRVRYLEAAAQARNALVLGDGDGRFSERLITRHPGLNIDSIELSRKMIAVCKHRSAACSNLNLVHGDARTIPFPGNQYDLIATHFFLDCFSSTDVEQLVRKIAAHSVPNALWLISDFRKPPSGWRAVHAEAWLRTMYFFFRLATGLSTRSLPNHREILPRNGFSLLTQYASMGDFVCSELWQYSGLRGGGK